MSFLSPVFFLLIAVICPVYYLFRRLERTSGIRVSAKKIFNPADKPSLKVFLSRNLSFLRLVALIFIVFALARPQKPLEDSKIVTEGIDIVLAIDVSGSMLAEDFTLDSRRVNRLEAVKDVVNSFIKGRESDRIGVVVFGARAYTLSPLTVDYDWLLQNLDRVKVGMAEDGTAVGAGLAAALNRLKDTKAESKIVILLTDGRNNAGKVTPDVAAQSAKALGIKVYTIGAGTKGMAPYPMKDFFGNTVYRPVKIEIDEDALIKIASQTKAKYFRATDTKSLRKIYQEIDRMEKTPIEEKGYREYREMFPVFLYIVLELILLEVLLGRTLLRRLP